MFLAGPIVGFDEIIQDSTHLNIEQKVDKLLSIHPMLSKSAQNESAKVHAIPRHEENLTNRFLSALFLLLIFSLTRFVFPHHIGHLLQIFNIQSSTKKHIRDQIENNDRASFWFYLVYMISVAIILSYWAGQYKSYQGGILFGICLLVISLFIGIKNSLIRLIGWVFNAKEAVSQYLFNKKLANEFVGLLLFPIAMFILASTGKGKIGLMILAATLYAFMLLYGYIRSLPLLTNLFRINFIHFLLYLCAFEIIPALILLRMIA